MDNYKIHKSIVDDNVLSEFSNVLGDTLFTNFQNTCNIEQAISCASLFWPEIVEVENHIFIRQFYNDFDIKELKKRFNNDKQEIERRINVWSISDLFLMSQTESIQNDKIFDEFAKTLLLFWQLRFKQLFPDRDIVVELGQELYGENGLAITVYEK